jgi:hypothetical protein
MRLGFSWQLRMSCRPKLYYRVVTCNTIVTARIDKNTLSACAIFLVFYVACAFLLPIWAWKPVLIAETDRSAEIG